MCRRIHAILLLTVVLIASLVPTVQPPLVTSTTSTYSGNYVVPITIHTSLPQPVYNYSLELVLTSQNFTDWDKINTTNIYFTDNKNQPLYYWIEYLNKTEEQAIIWVNTTLTNTTIYMHYGGANPYSNYDDPKRVFLWFDTDGNPSSYTISQVTGTATWSQDTSNGVPAPSLEATYSSVGEEIAYPSSVYGYNYVISAYLRGSTYSANVQPALALRYTPGNTVLEFRLHPQVSTVSYSAGIDEKNIANPSDNFIWYTNSFTLDPTTWYHVVAIAYNDKVRMIIYSMNGTLLADSGWITTNITTSGYAGPIYVDGTSGTSIWWDNITIYKYVDPSDYTVSIGEPLVSGKYVVPITLTYYGSTPVYNYSLELILTSNNFTGWSYVSATNIYFIDSNGHPLYYWIEELNTTTEYAKIWVNITLTNTTIYMYYGGYNPYSNYDNPNKVFLFYDDFSSNTIGTKWDEIITGGTSSLVISNGVLEIDNDGSYRAIARTKQEFGRNIVIDVRAKKVENIEIYWCWDGVSYSSSYGVPENEYTLMYLSWASPTQLDLRKNVGGTWTNLDTLSTTLDTNWHTYKIVVTSSNMIVYMDGTKILSGTDTTYSSGYIALSGREQPAGITAEYDWIRVYKYVDPSKYTVSIGEPELVAQSIIPVALSYSGSEPIYNYSLMLIFNTTTISNWNTVFGNQNSNTIYVLDSNGHPLYYWIETYNVTEEKLVLWVNTTLTNTTIYVYVGAKTNPYITYDNPSKTFLFWYDFSDGIDTTIWGGDTSSFSIGNGYIYTTTSTVGIYVVNHVWSGNIAIDSMVSLSSGARGDIKIYMNPSIKSTSTVTSQSYDLNCRAPNGDINIRYWDGSSTTPTYIASTTYTWDTAWHVWTLSIYNGLLTGYIDYRKILSGTSNVLTNGTIAVCSDNIDSGSINFSWVRVRKYVDPSNYTVSITGIIGLGNIYGGYMSVEPTHVFGVLSVVNSYSYTTNFTVVVTDNGTASENYTVTVTDTVSGETIYNATVELQPGESYTLWFTHTWTSPTNTTLDFILYGVNNTVYTNITVPVEIVEVSGVYVPITITYYGSQPVSDYTLMINLTSNNFNAWNYMGGNTTIAFLDSNGDPLYYWVDYLNKTEEQAIIYVNITLTNTTIYMYIDLDPNPLISYDNPYRTFLWYDGFETWSGWVQHGSGVVSQTSSPVRHGSHALLKNSYGDPNGGYKQLPFTLNFPFILEAYIDRTQANSNYGADRIGVIDNNGNGYGIDRDSNGGNIIIDKRSSYSATTYGQASLSVNPAVGQWYMAQLIWNNGEIIARIYLPPTYRLIGSTSYSDTSYTSFTRVYVFGGYPYVVDDMRIRKYVDPSTYSVVIGSVHGIAGAVFIGSISPTNVTVSIQSENSSAYVVFNMTVQNIGSDTGWVIVELIGDNDTTLYSNNITLTGGSSWSSIYNATFTYNDHGIHEWYYVLLNSTSTILNQTVTIIVAVNITLTYNYIQVFNQTVQPSWINSSWYNYTISIPEPTSLEEWIPTMWYNYTQSANIVLNSVSWIQANNIPRIIGSSACITLYTNTTGNWTQAYHVCNSYAYYLRIEIVFEPLGGAPPDYPNAYIYILVWNNNLNNYTYIYSIYIPSGNQTVLLFANTYYKLEIPASGTTIHGYSFQLDKYVLDNNIVDPPSIYLDGSHTVTIYYKIYSGTAPPPTTTTGIAPSPYPPPTYTFPYVTVPVVPPSVNVSIPGTPKIGYPGLDTPETVFSLLLYIALIILFVKLFNVYQAVAVASGIMMVLSIFLFGIVAMWLYFILFIIAVALYWKLGGT